MRSGVTLADLRKEVLIETGASTDAGHAVFAVEHLNQLINRTERWMAMERDWGGLEFEENVSVAADTQFVTLPTNINFTEITGASVLFGSEWLTIYHNISLNDRSLYSDTQRATPIQRWEVQAPGNVNFEVWPIGSQAQTIRFVGEKKLGAMVNDDDTCTLDGDVIVMRVAAQILGRDRKEDAALLLKMAETMTDNIVKKRGSLKAETLNLGRGGADRPPLRPGIDFIASGDS
jgi:hypothetical protein